MAAKAKTAAVKTAAVKVETISTRQLAAALAEKHEISQKAANLFVEDAIALITKHLKKGARIRLNGLGILVVRKLSYGEGVERVFPIYSPLVDSVVVVRKGKVRRAKLYYLRGRTGKAARITERVENTAPASAA